MTNIQAGKAIIDLKALITGIHKGKIPSKRELIQANMDLSELFDKLHELPEEVVL